MRCPCGSSEIPPRDFREYLRGNQEARLAARAVVKGEAFGGAVMEARGDGLYLGPETRQDGPGTHETGDPSKSREGWPAWMRRLLGG